MDVRPKDPLITGVSAGSRATETKGIEATAKQITFNRTLFGFIKTVLLNCLPAIAIPFSR
jgi:hypothetical protein